MSAKTSICVHISVSILLLAALTGCGKTEPSVSGSVDKEVAITIDSLVSQAAAGNIDNVRLLIKGSINVNDKNSLGSTPLVDAAWNGRRDVVMLLLDEKADINGANTNFMTPIFAAVSQKHEDVSITLLERGANANLANSSGVVPLMEAAWQGNSKLVSLLVTKGANVNYKNPKDSATALSLARAADQQETVKTLQELGAKE